MVFIESRGSMEKKKYRYSLAEELISSISHGIGALFSIVALVLLIIKSVQLESVSALSSSLVYGFSLIILYLMSTLYHSLSPNLVAKKVFRILDHCSIYLLIIGTYTPILLYAMGDKRALILFVIMLAIGITGIVLNAISIEKFKVYSFISYLLLGWIIIFSLPTFLKVISKTAITYIVWGGLSYTVGAIIYLIGKKVKYMHSIWHFFVLTASVLHFIAIYFYILK